MRIAIARCPWPWVRSTALKNAVGAAARARTRTRLPALAPSLCKLERQGRREEALSELDRETAAWAKLRTQAIIQFRAAKQVRIRPDACAIH